MSSRRVKNSCSAWSYECISNRVDDFETGITLPGRSDVSPATTTPRRLQLASNLVTKCTNRQILFTCKLNSFATLTAIISHAVIKTYLQLGHYVTFKLPEITMTQTPVIKIIIIIIISQWLTTGQQLVPKLVIHTAWSSASDLNLTAPFRLLKGNH